MTSEGGRDTQQIFMATPEVENHSFCQTWKNPCSRWGHHCKKEAYMGGSYIIAQRVNR